MASWEKFKSFPLRGKARQIPDGMFNKCRKCGAIYIQQNFEDHLFVCQECGFYHALPSDKRITSLVDKDSFVETHTSLVTSDPLQFKAIEAYRDRVLRENKKTNMKEAIVTGHCTIDRQKCYLGVLEQAFLMASMGSVVCEKITRLFEDAMVDKVPVIIVNASGGARMHEGLISLMQMSKTSAAVARFSQKGLLYVSILTNPTMAGVMASYASLGDIIIAEPKALIGFTGPRVIRETLRIELPKGFQLSEFQLAHGQIDLIVERKAMRSKLSDILSYTCNSNPNNKHAVTASTEK